MSRQAIFLNQPAKYLQISTLILLAFTTAFFPRLLDAAGVPSTVNFVHFATVSFCCGVALVKTRARNRQQIAITGTLIWGLLILLGVMIVSALLNDVGPINVVMHFLMLGEPFLLLIAIICTPISPINLKRLKNWIAVCAFINLLLAYIMWPVTYADLLPRNGMGYEDSIQGVFYLSGAGNTVSTSVSLTFACYFLVNAKNVSLLFRLLLLAAALVQLIISDSKQIVFVFLLAGVIFALTKIKELSKAIIYAILFVIFISVFLWCVENLEAFLAFKQWMARSELYGPDGEVTITKTSIFRLAPSYYQSPLNWLFGLGPGHTVGRLGGWMLRDYAHLLQPLGSTIHPASMDVWRILETSLVAKDSTMFSPFFGWAGIWGDLGFLGLGAYLYLGSIVWRRLCLSDMFRFLLLTVFVFGLVFTQMEEPGYMLFVATLIGLQWHEQQQRSGYKTQE
jgi:hypothetical protein